MRGAWPRLQLERRTAASRRMAWLSPLLAVGLTLVVAAAIFAVAGHPVGTALYVYFIEPVTTVWSLEELVVKMTPLVLIAVGLAICFRANVWNIGAEGQLTAGAILGSAVPILWPDWQSPSALLCMLLLGAAGGTLWAAIPALLKNRFAANEILVSLMLVYVAQLLLDWLVRGPWRDPQGFNFPKSVSFEGWQLLPTLGDGRVHLGAALALVAVAVAAVFLARTLKGFELRVSGASARAAGFGGFSRRGVVWLCFGISGALAGLAGIAEVAGPAGNLNPVVSPGYGFTAIIVAFLGRLNPGGALVAAFVLGISYLGGEAAQVELGLSDKLAQVLQGLLLFFILACDALVHHRIRLRPPPMAHAAVD